MGADAKKEKKERSNMEHEERWSRKVEAYNEAMIERQRKIDAKELRKKLRQEKRAERDAARELKAKEKLEMEIALHKQREKDEIEKENEKLRIAGQTPDGESMHRFDDSMSESSESHASIAMSEMDEEEALNRMQSQMDIPVLSDSSELTE